MGLVLILITVLIKSARGKHKEKVHRWEKIWISEARVINRHKMRFNERGFLSDHSRIQIDFLIEDLKDPSKIMQAFANNYFMDSTKALFRGFGWYDAEKTEIGDIVSLTDYYLPHEQSDTFGHRGYYFSGTNPEDMLRIISYENMSLRTRDRIPVGRLQLATRFAEGVPKEMSSQ